MSYRSTEEGSRDHPRVVSAELEHRAAILFEEAKGWGLAKWAEPILSVVFDGVSDTVDFQVKSLLQMADEQSRYLRIQAPLHEGNDDMDDPSKTNIKVLKLVAKDLVATHSDAIDEMVERLKR